MRRLAASRLRRAAVLPSCCGHPPAPQPQHQRALCSQQPAGPATPPPPPRERAGPPPRGGGAALAAAARARADASPFALYLGALVVGMVGATYASVPLYRLFCAATGFGGTTRRVEDVSAMRAAAEGGRGSVGASPGGAASAAAPPRREVVVTFNADCAEGMPWRFWPSQRSLVVRPGESALAFYTARNAGPEAVTGVATYNVAPAAAGSHFAKVQCFCFEEQRLEAGETVDLPVLFYLDPAFEADRACAGVGALTLSYTFWRTDGAEANARAARAALDAQAAGLLLHHQPAAGAQQPQQQQPPALVAAAAH